MPPPMPSWQPIMDRVWYCHCCSKRNPASAPGKMGQPPKCIVCGRPASWTVKVFHPFHGDQARSMNPYHVAERLSSSEAEREAMDDNRFRPLHIAAAAGNLATVRSILALNPFLNVRVTFDWTALHLACDGGHAAVVEALLDAGADVEAVTERELLTPLLVACKRGHGKVVSVLIPRGANIRAKDKAGREPIHYAAMCGALLAGVHLITAGADKNSLDQDGWSPRQYADLHGHESFVKLLTLAEGKVTEIYSMPVESYHNSLWFDLRRGYVTQLADRKTHEDNKQDKLIKEIEAIRRQCRGEAKRKAGRRLEEHRTNS